MKKEHKATWEDGRAFKGVSCSCGFLPKRPKVLKNHVLKHDPAGVAKWREELYQQAGISRWMLY